MSEKIFLALDTGFNDVQIVYDALYSRLEECKQERYKAEEDELGPWPEMDEEIDRLVHIMMKIQLNLDRKQRRDLYRKADIKFRTLTKKGADQ